MVAGATWVLSVLKVKRKDGKVEMHKSTPCLLSALKVDKGDVVMHNAWLPGECH